MFKFQLFVALIYLCSLVELPFLKYLKFLIMFWTVLPYFCVMLLFHVLYH